MHEYCANKRDIYPVSFASFHSHIFQSLLLAIVLRHLMLTFLFQYLSHICLQFYIQT